MVNIGIMAWFQLEKQYIASELCENRNVENSDCGGSCVLSKSVNDAKPVQMITLEFKPVVYSVGEVLSINPNMPVVTIIPKKIPLRQNAYLDGVFHPPELCV